MTQLTKFRIVSYAIGVATGIIGTLAFFAPKAKADYYQVQDNGIVNYVTSKQGRERGDIRNGIKKGNFDILPMPQKPERPRYERTSGKTREERTAIIERNKVLGMKYQLELNKWNKEVKARKQFFQNISRPNRTRDVQDYQWKQKVAEHAKKTTK